MIILSQPISGKYTLIEAEDHKIATNFVVNPNQQAATMDT
jgi:hypothetical protein